MRERKWEGGRETRERGIEREREGERERDREREREGERGREREEKQSTLRSLVHNIRNASRRLNVHWRVCCITSWRVSRRVL